MEDYSKELTDVQKAVKIFTDVLNKRIEELKNENKKLTKQLILCDVSQQSELFSNLLSKLKEGNMCSYAGDQLIDEYLELLNCG
jgi:hypothetical protein